MNNFVLTFASPLLVYSRFGKVTFFGYIILPDFPISKQLDFIHPPIHPAGKNDPLQSFSKK